MHEIDDDELNDGKTDKTSAKKENLINILEIGGGLIFAMLAVACSDAGFHIWGFFFGFLAVICGLAIVAHHLQKLGLKYVMTGLVISLVLMAVFFGFLAFHKPESLFEPKPRLSFGVSGKPKSDIWLTNDFLLVKGQYHATDFPGLLVLPISPGSHAAQLTLNLLNDVEDTEANGAEILFITTNEIAIVPQMTLNMNWQVSDIGETGRQALGILMPVMPADTVFQLPPLYFPDVENQLGKIIFTRVILQGTGIRRKEFAFWINFRSVTNIDYPQFVVRKSLVNNGSNFFTAGFEIDDDSPTNHF